MYVSTRWTLEGELNLYCARIASRDAGTVSGCALSTPLGARVALSGSEGALLHGHFHFRSDLFWSFGSRIGTLSSDETICPWLCCCTAWCSEHWIYLGPRVPIGKSLPTDCEGQSRVGTWSLLIRRGCGWTRPPSEFLGVPWHDGCTRIWKTKTQG